MRTPHVHAEIIKAWADGEKIEFYDTYAKEPFWRDAPRPSWDVNAQYRIKPEPKPDVTLARWVFRDGSTSHHCEDANVRFTFDGETGALKKAEAIL